MSQYEQAVALVDKARSQGIEAHITGLVGEL
jgi:cell division septation protein DedD